MSNQKQQQMGKGSSSSSSSPSSSSFMADLFGVKESPSSSTSGSIFASMFPPPSTGFGWNSTSSDFSVRRSKHPSGSQIWSTKEENVAKNSEGLNMERRSDFQERGEPSPLSSSLYYGAQENMYGKTSSAQTSGACSTWKKDGKDDDNNGNNFHCASRGNWWQGSLYY